MSKQEGTRARWLAGWRARLRRHGFALPVFLGLALLYTYPLAWHPFSRIIGQGDDVLQGYWNMWWTRQALIESGHYPFVTPLMHHPHGLALYFHTHNFLNSVLALPVQLCCGIVPAFNLVALLTFVLAGLGAYALVFYLVRSRAAALVAGLVFAFSPYMVLPLRLGHLHLLSTGWLPLYMLALLHGLRARWTSLLLAALLLLLVGLTDWHYTLYGIFLAVLVGLYEAVRLRRWQRIAWLGGKLALVGGLFALAMSPIVVPALLELSGDQYAVRGLWHSRLHAADVLAFFLPNIFHPLWGEWASSIFYGRLTPGYIVGGVVMLGYVPLALAVLAALHERRRGGLWLLVFGVFFVLALGPHLKINGINTYDTAHPVPLPYILFYQLPFMSVHRAPSRFFVGVLLALAVLAGLGVRWLWQHPALARRSPWVRRALVAGVALLVLFEYWPQPFPTTSLDAEPRSPFYAQLAEAAGEGAILQLPYPADTSPLWQTIHGRPTVGGAISRTPPHPWDNARFFDALLEVDPDLLESVGRGDDPAAVRAALRCQGVRYVVVYKREMDWVDEPDNLLALEARLFAGVSPTYEDSLLRAYELAEPPPHTLYWTLAPAEWYDGQTNEQGVMYRWAQGEAGSLLLYPCRQPQAPRQAVVQFDIFGIATPRTIEASLNGVPLGSFGIPAERVRQVRLLLPLHAGENRLTLRSAEPAIAPGSLGYEDDTRRISFNLSQVWAAARKEE